VTSDEQLIADFQRGSGDAFEALFERYRQPIWGFFRRRLDDAARAEELAQDTFMAVLKGASRYEPRALFRTYLYGIALNLLSEERRRMRHRRTESLDDAARIADEAPSPDGRIWLKDALAELDATEREILLLREYEQLSYAEIATLLGLPLNTVRSRLFRARLALKTRLTFTTGSELGIRR